MLGEVAGQLPDRGSDQTLIIVVSDHGFAVFNHKVHLNRWLIERGYLAPKGEGESGSLQGVDWSQSQAYAVGLNSIYLNLAGREGQGYVLPRQHEPIVDRIRDELLAWNGPDGGPVVRRALRRDEAFQGPLMEYGPDLVVGYTPGYRASGEIGTGRWGKAIIEPNCDHWGADHCIDSEAVPGVLFCNQGLADLPHPSYRDIPALAIGAALESGGSAPPPSFSEEDSDAVEERLKGLGYL